MTIMEKIREILHEGVIYKRETSDGELTKDILEQLDNLEFEGAASDKENLKSDMQHVGDDLRVGIRECKEKYHLEYV